MKYGSPSRGAALERYGWVVVWLAICVFHFTTLRAPAGDQGALLADQALHHGGVTLTYFHPPHLPYQWKNADYGSKPALLWLLKKSLNHFGIGIIPLRLPSIFSGLLALLLLTAVLRKTGLPFAGQIGMLLFGLGHVFFFTTHSGRSEAELFLITVINFSWVIWGGGRVVAFIVGMLAGLGLGFHACAIFLLASMPVLLVYKDGRRGVLSPRNIWWCIGVLSGALVMIHTMDMDAAIMALHLDHALYGHIHFQSPLIFWWNANGRDVFSNVLSLLGQPLEADPAKKFQAVFFGSLIVALCLQLRRFRRLPRSQQLLLVFTLSYLAAFDLLTGSRNPAYRLFMEPWLWIQALILSSALWSGERSLDRTDYAIVAVVGFILFTAFFDVQGYIIVEAILIRWVAGFKGTRRRKAVWITLIVLAVSAFNFDAVIGTWAWGRYLARYAPGRLFLTVAWPCLFFLVRPQGIPWKGGAIPGRVWAVFFGLLLIGRLGVDGGLNEKECRTVRENAALVAALLKRSSGKTDFRAIAPSELWVYAPSIPIQDIELVCDVKKHRIPVDLAALVSHYHPSYILMPSSCVPLLESDALKSGGPGIREGKIWPGPFWPDAPLQEVTLVPAASGPSAQ